MTTIKTILSSPMTWELVTVLFLLLLVVGVVALLRRPLAALVAHVVPSVASGRPVPVGATGTKPVRLGGMNATIAFTHRTVSQIIGLEMSAANLLAVFLSVTCAVAGAFILAYTYYHSIFIPSIAALAMLVLAILIENITLSSLKNIRLSNAEIQKQDDEYYETLNKQLNEQLTEKVTKHAKQQVLQALTKEEVKDRQRAHKQEQREQRELIKQKRNLVKQRMRRARRDRNASIPFAAVGICFSAVAGGLFWHQVLAGLDIRLNIAISTMFALAVSVTFILGELFKRVQDEAIKEAMGNNELQQEMLKQQADDISMETMIETMYAVRVDPVAKQEMLNAMKIEFVKMIKLASEQSTKRLLAGSETVSPETKQTVESVSPNLPVSSVIVSEEVREPVIKQESSNETATKQEVRETEPVTDPGFPVVEETVSAKPVSSMTAKLGMVESMMYDAVVANLDALSDLVSLSQTLSLKDLTLHLQSRFSRHASFLTEERVANVMASVKRNYPDLFCETAGRNWIVNTVDASAGVSLETDEHETVSPHVSRRPRITTKLAPLFDETDNEREEERKETTTKPERNTDKLKRSSAVSSTAPKKATTGETETVAKIRRLVNRNPNIDAMELAKKANVTPQYARKIKKNLLAEVSA